MSKKVRYNKSSPVRLAKEEHNETVYQNANIQKGRGCPNCNGTGNRGRMGIFEIFVVNDEIQRMIFDKMSAAELRQRAAAGEQKAKLAREFGVSRETLYQYLRADQ